MLKKIHGHHLVIERREHKGEMQREDEKYMFYTSFRLNIIC